MPPHPLLDKSKYHLHHSATDDTGNKNTRLTFRSHDCN